MSHPRWAEEVPAPETYKAPAGRSRDEAIHEQDEAACGRENRRIRLDDGHEALASVELKYLGGRRIYAYLRYSQGGETQNRYLGEAPGETRLERLKAAWELVRKT